MLGRDELVMHLIGLLLRRREYLAQGRAEVLLPALHSRKTRDSRLRVVENDGDVRTDFAENRSDDSFRLFEHRDEQMLRLNLLVLISFSKLDRGLNCFLPS